MKVLHLISSLKVGGAESLLVDLVAELQSMGVENYVIYFHDGPNSEKIRNLKIDCVQVSGLFKMYDPFFLFNLFRTIKKINPDCIHSSLWAANILGTIFAKLLRIPNLSVIHLASNVEGETQNSKLRSLLDRITFWSDKLVTVSYSTHKQLIDKYPDLKNRLNVILNGIRLDSVTPAKRDNHNFVIGTVGRFIPRKNHKLLIEAFSELRRDKIELHLVGQGPLEVELKNLVESLNLQKYVKFIKTDNARIFYSTFDCFVLPSEQEGLSIALLEAMSAGLPVIVSGVKNLEHDVITHRKDGLVFNLTKNDLVRALRLIVDDKELRDRLAKNGNLLVQNYSLDRMTTNYFDIYKGLSNNSNRI